MFGCNCSEDVSELEVKIKELKSEKRKLESVIEDQKTDIKELKRDLEIASEDFDILSRREEAKHAFELENFKDKEVISLKDEVVSSTKRIAVLENENKMLGKIVDVNKDIIDVKNLVSTLIEKLPTVNINGMVTQPVAKAKK